MEKVRYTLTLESLWTARRRIVYLMHRTQQMTYTTGFQVANESLSRLPSTMEMYARRLSLCPVYLQEACVPIENI